MTLTHFEKNVPLVVERKADEVCAEVGWGGVEDPM